MFTWESVGEGEDIYTSADVIKFKRRYRLQISVLILSKFKQMNNFYSSSNHHITKFRADIPKSDIKLTPYEVKWKS